MALIANEFAFLDATGFHLQWLGLLLCTDLLILLLLTINIHLKVSAHLIVSSLSVSVSAMTLFDNYFLIRAGCNCWFIRAFICLIQCLAEYLVNKSWTCESYVKPFLHVVLVYVRTFAFQFQNINIISTNFLKFYCTSCNWESCVAAIIWPQILGVCLDIEEIVYFSGDHISKIVRGACTHEINHWVVSGTSLINTLQWATCLEKLHTSRSLSI